MKSDKIGILGSGVVGKTLTLGFEKHGYKVMTGSREPQKFDEWKTKEKYEGETGTFEEVAAFADILVLAVKGSMVDEAIKLAGLENMKYKIMIDASNPIDDLSPTDGVLNFFTETDNSLMEQLQNGFPEIKFVKAFNSVGAAHMVNPDFKGGKPSMFICGNDLQAKKKVKEILDLFGWETEDMGTEVAARAIEPLCMLWCIPGLRENRWDHAFKLLKK